MINDCGPRAVRQGKLTSADVFLVDILETKSTLLAGQQNKDGKKARAGKSGEWLGSDSLTWDTRAHHMVPAPGNAIASPSSNMLSSQCSLGAAGALHYSLISHLERDAVVCPRTHHPASRFPLCLKPLWSHDMALRLAGMI
jgi:hypothetical protein